MSPEPPGFTPQRAGWTDRWLWGLAALALLLRAALALRDVGTVDSLFVPDDTYYTLAIARSLARGLGPSTDGAQLTSGFQPLIAFLQVPLFWASATPEAPLRWTLLLLALSDAASTLFLGVLGHRWVGAGAGRLAAGLWALSPLAVANALGGLETSLAVALQLGLVLAWSAARASPRPRAFILPGLLCGLALLARVDSVFLVGALGLLELWRGRRTSVVVAAIVAAAVVAPWWGYCTARFGSPVPQSGQAVREVVRSHQERYLRVPQQMGWAAGTLLGGPLVDSPRLREALFQHSGLGIVAWIALALCMATGLRGGSSAEFPRQALALHGLAVLCLYTFYVPALWFFRRYLAPCEALLTLLLATGVSQLGQRSGPLQRVAPVASALLVLLALRGTLPLLWERPQGSREDGLHGAKGYRAPVLELLSRAPSGAVIGALQSGALGYFADGRGIQVVNLDGVVDHAALEAMRGKRLDAYARSRGVTHLADWDVNLSTFLEHSGDARLTPEHLRLLAQAPPQGSDRFLLVEVRWP